jgi:hypothetical protein
LSFKPLWEMKPIRATRSAAQREHLGQHLERAHVALVGHDARVLILDLAAALASWERIMRTAVEHVERLEARDDDRLAVVGGDELERPRPTTVATWPGPMKPSSAGRATRAAPAAAGTIVTWLHMQRSSARPPPSRA